MKRRILLAAIILFIAVFAIGLWWAVAKGPLRNPNAALRDFYNSKSRAEDQLIDPLILNGRRVFPLVLAEVQNKNMEKRRYAIRFLGNGHYREAIPILEQVLSDKSEINYFRAMEIWGHQEIWGHHTN